MKLKLYSLEQPIELSKHRPITCEVYSIGVQGNKHSAYWFSEIDTDDYSHTRQDLEILNYVASPADGQEVESGEYTLFQERV